MRKKPVIIALALVLAAGGAGTGIWYYRTQMGGTASQENAVFVDSVGEITGLTGANGVFSRFSGVVEPQRTEKIDLASGLKVKKVYVSVGDEVEVGTKLFSYDTDEAQDSIAQLEIDIENYDISIQSSESQVKQLEKERDKVSNDEKLAYTTQIMTTQNSIKRYEYEKKSKQAEMESLKKQIANADVTSPLQGIVKTISSTDGQDDDTSSSMSSDDGSSSAFMTIMATGEYRIKGKINEQNMAEIQEGTSMIVYSRVDESRTWKGTLTSIDKENASSNQSSSYYAISDSGDSSMTNSSSYPFYVDLESSDDLMLGQHVFLMVDYGQENETDGLWLDDYYFITDEDGAVTNYVWAVDENDCLEKREVTFGLFDEDSLRYEILDGLTVEDYIAFPSEDCVEGAPVTRNVDQVSDESIDMEGDFGDIGEEDFMDEYVDSVDDGVDFVEEGDMGEEEFVDDGADFVEE